MGKKKPSRWNELLKQVALDDGLPVRESGYWAKEKLWFWNRYIEITTTAMVGHPAWPAGVAYVDLFSGPGVCEVTATRERFPGSPVIAASAPKPFVKILLCELDNDCASACESRLSALLQPDCFQVFRGDCNERVCDIVRAIPDHALTLAFLDPTGLHLWFETVAQLSSHGAVDLLILFPDAIDIIRNERHLYFADTESNLDRVLGLSADWRDRVRLLNSTDSTKRRRLFATIYEEQLKRHLGYRHFANEIIRGPQGPLYRLIYATKHERGIDFWNKSVARELGGQSRLFM